MAEATSQPGEVGVEGKASEQALYERLNAQVAEMRQEQEIKKLPQNFLTELASRDPDFYRELMAVKAEENFTDAQLETVNDFLNAKEATLAKKESDTKETERKRKEESLKKTVDNYGFEEKEKVQVTVERKGDVLVSIISIPAGKNPLILRRNGENNPWGLSELKHTVALSYEDFDDALNDAKLLQGLLLHPKKPEEAKSARPFSRRGDGLTFNGEFLGYVKQPYYTKGSQVADYLNDLYKDYGYVSLALKPEQQAEYTRQYEALTAENKLEIDTFKTKFEGLNLSNDELYKMLKWLSTLKVALGGPYTHPQYQLRGYDSLDRKIAADILKDTPTKELLLKDLAGALASPFNDSKRLPRIHADFVLQKGRLYKERKQGAAAAKEAQQIETMSYVEFKTRNNLPLFDTLLSDFTEIATKPEKTMYSYNSRDYLVDTEVLADRIIQIRLSGKSNPHPTEKKRWDAYREEVKTAFKDKNGYEAKDLSLSTSEKLRGVTLITLKGLPQAAASSAATEVAAASTGAPRAASSAAPQARAVGSAARAEVAAAAPEIPIDYRADAKSHPEKYKEMVAGKDAFKFNPPDKKAEDAIRIEDLVADRDLMLTSTRYTGVEFSYHADGAFGPSWYSPDGKQRLVIYEGDEIGFKKPEAPAVSAAPAAEGAAAAPTVVAASEAPAAVEPLITLEPAAEEFYAEGVSPAPEVTQDSLDLDRENTVGELVSMARAVGQNLSPKKLERNLLLKERNMKDPGIEIVGEPKVRNGVALVTLQFTPLKGEAVLRHYMAMAGDETDVALSDLEKVGATTVENRRATKRLFHDQINNWQVIDNLNWKNAIPMQDKRAEAVAQLVVKEHERLAKKEEKHPDSPRLKEQYAYLEGILDTLQKENPAVFARLKTTTLAPALARLTREGGPLVAGVEEPEEEGGADEGRDLYAGRQGEPSVERPGERAA